MKKVGCSVQINLHLVNLIQRQVNFLQTANLEMCLKKLAVLSILFLVQVCASKRTPNCDALYQTKILRENLHEGLFIIGGWPQLELKKDAGEEVEVDCSHIGFRGGDPALSPVVELKWFKEEKLLNQDDNEKVSISGCNKKPFINGVTLSMKNLTTSDSGKYHCRLWLQGGFPNQPFVFEETYQLEIEPSYSKTPTHPTSLMRITTSFQEVKKIGEMKDEVILVAIIVAITGCGIIVIVASCKHKNGVMTVKRYLRKSMSNEQQGYHVGGKMTSKSLGSGEQQLLKTKFLHLFPFLNEEDMANIFDVEINRQSLCCNLEHSLPIVLGTGNFGQVFKGKIRESKGNFIPVALKRLNDRCNMQEMENFLKEVLHLVKAGSHENIVSLKGTVLLDVFLCKDIESTIICRPPIIAMELATGGNLRKFLLDERTKLPINDEKDGNRITCKDLMSFALQVAKGMHHLAVKKIVHRDLAARNILVTKGMVLKISDFGMSKFLAEDKEYYELKQNDITPVKWTAPESIWTRKFTLESDVWSYGILLWEMMSLGDIPYKNISPTQIYSHISTGNRLPQPRLCPLDVFLIMHECWQWQSTSRPNFTYLVQVFEDFVKTSSNAAYASALTPARLRVNGISSTLNKTESTGSCDSYLPMLGSNSSSTAISNTSSMTSVDASSCSHNGISDQLFEMRNPVYGQ